MEDIGKKTGDNIFLFSFLDISHRTCTIFINVNDGQSQTTNQSVNSGNVNNNNKEIIMHHRDEQPLIYLTLYSDVYINQNTNACVCIYQGSGVPFPICTSKTYLRKMFIYSKIITESL